MVRQALAVIATLAGCLALHGEAYRLKYITTVDIIEDGKAIGTRKLKPGTLVEIVDTQEQAEAAPTTSAVPSGANLRISKLSPVMFKTTRQAVAHTFNAKISLSDYYVGPYEGKNKEFWSIEVYAYNSAWDGLEIFRGYARKSSSVGRQVERELADGSEHDCHAKLTYVKNPDYDDIVLLEAFELVSERR